MESKIETGSEDVIEEKRRHGGEEGVERGGHRRSALGLLGGCGKNLHGTAGGGSPGRNHRNAAATPSQQAKLGQLGQDPNHQFVAAAPAPISRKSLLLLSLEQVLAKYIHEVHVGPHLLSISTAIAVMYHTVSRPFPFLHHGPASPRHVPPFKITLIARREVHPCGAVFPTPTGLPKVMISLSSGATEP